MESNWEIVKQKKTEHLKKELEIFIGKLEMIRSNSISLEALRGLMVNFQGGRKPLKAMANLRITANNELAVQAFEPKMLSAIEKAILDKQWGYGVERRTEEEVFFVLTPITKEIKERLIEEVKLITEGGKKVFRLIREDLEKWLKKEPRLSQDEKRNYEKQKDKLVEDYKSKLVAAEKKKINELSS